MPIIVDCPECGKAYRVADDKAGMRMKCKECAAVVPIPDDDLLTDDEFEELDDSLETRRPKRSTSSRERPSPRGRRSKKPPTGWKSPKVQYAGGAAIVVVTTGIVLLILNLKGFFGGNKEAGAAANDGNKGVAEFVIHEPLIVRRNSSPRFRMLYHIEITRKNGDRFVEKTDHVLASSEAHKDPQSTLTRAKLKSAPPPATPEEAAAAKSLIDRHRTKLKRIAIAKLEYHQKYNALPTSYMSNRGLSWRVHLLPFLGHKKLYDQFKLDEPWDSPHNKALIPQMPAEFRSHVNMAPGKTAFHVFVGAGTPYGVPPVGEMATYDCNLNYEVIKGKIDENETYSFKLELYSNTGPKREVITRTVSFSGRELKSRPKVSWHIEVPVDKELYRPTRIRDIVDGTANVISTVIAGPETAEIWTKPGGLQLDPDDPFPVLGTIPSDGMQVVMFDGSTHTIPVNCSNRKFVLAVGHYDMIPAGFDPATLHIQ